jgi:hypothetical protein
MSNHRQLAMPLKLKAKHVWAHGFLIGLFLGAIGIFMYFYGATTPTFSPTDEQTSQPLVEAQSGQIPTSNPEIFPTTLSNPIADLQSQLARIFDGIRESNQKKDLDRLSGFYSPKFPLLSKKTQSIKQSWRLYDYQKMEFKIHEINMLDEDTAVAWVTWDVDLKELSTDKVKNISKTYQVTFIKESGQWNIIGLKNALW